MWVKFHPILRSLISIQFVGFGASLEVLGGPQLLMSCYELVCTFEFGSFILPRLNLHHILEGVIWTTYTCYLWLRSGVHAMRRILVEIKLLFCPLEIKVLFCPLLAFGARCT